MIKTVPKKNTLSEELTPLSQAYQIASNILIQSIPFIPSFKKYNITICHQKKFMWFRVAKVGTRTMFNVFEQANIKLDAEHAMLCYYPLNLYKEYFKFAFVRNPWDRLVSCWQHKVIDSNYFNFSNSRLIEMQTFGNFVDFVSELEMDNCNHHIRPQSKLIDLNNVDFIGRFENFEADILKVIEIIGIGSIQINHKNVSKRAPGYNQYYDVALKKKVAEIYREDIHIFGYRF
ncbi:MAG: sulfotransferase family protein [Okeania sp. SIO3B5]|uniref:sulfotransferase family 2 domain-containing protein n=1 Tax=Okeania sp. SIO3B5 TaxID=2607811 RepID=UPI00140030B3|nr:sulfotransferase family 2 domain-containing protein [Okeania sp. SIO3B5]NEO54641.1 sulfotransferase family protein [Okeania sp. SIO3B5]